MLSPISHSQICSNLIFYVILSQLFISVRNWVFFFVKTDLSMYALNA